MNFEEPAIFKVLKAIRKSLVWRAAVALLSISVIVFLGFGLSGVFSREVPLLLFVLAVLSSALIGGVKSGLLATIGSFLCAIYFFIPPENSFSIGSAKDIVRLGLFVIVGVILSFLIELLHYARSREAEKTLTLFIQERKLRQAHKETQIVLESIADAFFAINHQSEFTYVNQKGEELLNKKKNQLVGKNVWQELPDIVNTIIYSQYKKAAQTKKPVHFEYYDQSSQTWSRVHYYPHKDGMSAYVRDITADKKTEQALKETEAKMMLLAQSPFIGIAFAKEDGTISYGNPAYLSIIGRSKEEISQGRIKWQEITPSKWFPIDKRHIHEAKITGACTPYEKEYIHSDGSHVPVLVSFILHGKKRDQAVVFVVDNTKRKELERQKEEFLAEVSHEIKAPLAGAKAYEQLLQKELDKKNNDRATSVLVKMDTQLNKINSLINDLLDATRLKSGRVDFVVTKFPIDAVIDKTIEEMQTTYPKHQIRITKTSGATVQGDEQRIQQVLTNLVSNAAKYSPDADRIDISSSASKTTVTVCVKDYGIGIPKEKQSYLFTRLYRVKTKNQAIPGAGLGLYISAEIIKRLEGRVWLEKSDKNGSTFCFSLPRIT